MIHQQDHGAFYAYCRCGVCAPPRRKWNDALADDLAHIAVCSTRTKTT